MAGQVSRSFVVATALGAVLAGGCGDGVGRPLVALPEQATGSAGGGTGGFSGGGSGARSGWDGLGSRPGWPDDLNPDSGNGGWSGGGPGTPVPPGAYCESVADWPPDAQAAESILFSALYLLRSSQGCPEASATPRPPPLAPAPELTCSARLHARDMAERDYYSTVNLEGEGPAERIARAGYAAGVAVEYIGRWRATGEDPLPFAAVSEVVEQAGGCEVFLDPAYQAAGVGYFDGFFTLDLAGP